MTPPAIHFEAHPPERGRRQASVQLNCGCCCCCCCCLHTLGSVIGAAIAPAFGSNQAAMPTRYRLLVEEYEFDEDKDVLPAGSALRLPARTSGVALYWWTTLILMCLVPALVVLGGSGDGIIVAVLGIALGLPILQLIAAFLAALVLAASVRQDKKYQLIQVGKITLGTVAGTVLGILAMVGIAVGLGWMR